MARLTYKYIKDTVDHFLKVSKDQNKDPQGYQNLYNQQRGGIYLHTRGTNELGRRTQNL